MLCCILLHGTWITVDFLTITPGHLLLGSHFVGAKALRGRGVAAAELLTLSATRPPTPSRPSLGACIYQASLQPEP